MNIWLSNEINPYLFLISLNFSKHEIDNSISKKLISANCFKIIKEEEREEILWFMIINFVWMILIWNDKKFEGEESRLGNGETVLWKVSLINLLEKEIRE